MCVCVWGCPRKQVCDFGKSGKEELELPVSSGFGSVWAGVTFVLRVSVGVAFQGTQEDTHQNGGYTPAYMLFCSLASWEFLCIPRQSIEVKVARTHTHRQIKYRVGTLPLGHSSGVRSLGAWGALESAAQVIQDVMVAHYSGGRARAQSGEWQDVSQVPAKGVRKVTHGEGSKPWLPAVRCLGFLDLFSWFRVVSILAH